eukprot:SAG31_NODE_10608_length_1118_cov_1.019627_1_plen_103_part_00
MSTACAFFFGSAVVYGLGNHGTPLVGRQVLDRLERFQYVELLLCVLVRRADALEVAASLEGTVTFKKKKRCTNKQKSGLPDFTNTLEQRARHACSRFLYLNI